MFREWFTRERDGGGAWRHESIDRLRIFVNIIEESFIRSGIFIAAGDAEVPVDIIEGDALACTGVEWSIDNA